MGPNGGNDCHVIDDGQRRWLAVLGQPASERFPGGELLVIPMTDRAPFLDTEGMIRMPLTGAHGQTTPISWWRLGASNQDGPRALTLCASAQRDCPEGARFQATLLWRDGGGPPFVSALEQAAAVEAEPYTLILDDP